jgi:hypothetical protein
MFDVAWLLGQNELGHVLDHHIVCYNNPILEMRVALGTTRNTMEAVFYFVPRKVYFLFL